MRPFGEKDEGLHKRRSSLQLKFTSLKSSFWPTRKQGEHDDREAFASYLFRMQVIRQQDELDGNKKAVRKSQREMRSRRSARRVRPWYKENQPMRQNHLPQARQHKSRRNSTRARLLASSSSMLRHHAPKKRERKVGFRRGRIRFFAPISHLRRHSDRRYSCSEETDKHDDDKSAEELGQDQVRSSDTMFLDVGDPEFIDDNGSVERVLEAGKKRRRSSIWRNRFSFHS